MANPALKLVEKESMNKDKALDAALGQIERAFGKGSVMRMGQRETVETEVISSGSISLDLALGLVVYREVELLRFMDRRVPARQLWLYMQLPRLKSLAELVPLLMLNMHLTLFMRRSLGLILTNYFYISRMVVSRLLKLQIL